MSGNSRPSDFALHHASFKKQEIVKQEANIMIKKVKNGYKVVSEKTGKNLGGPYKTKEEAKKRLQQVEFFKRKKG
ncbi:MAG: hypothetical protein HY313_04425 [Acidobacteria bacterium]|nr:hypothetical protein [Acidobacteriota bacterium]